MAKLPSFQFYPGDWRKDMGVQSLNFHDRGVWWEMLLLMHESERRGVLVLNARAMTEEELSRLIGLDKQTLTTTLTTLLTTGVASRDEETGAIFSRRMVRDEKLRQVRTEAGKKGGNPALLNQNPTTIDKQRLTTGVKQNPTPSSSSSSSTSKQKTTPKASPSSFELPSWIPRDAWDAWIEVRSKMRAANTPTALELAVKTLEKLRTAGESPVDVLNQSVLKSYKGLFSVSSNGNGAGKKSGPTMSAMTFTNEPKPKTSAQLALERELEDKARYRARTEAEIAGRPQ